MTTMTDDPGQTDPTDPTAQPVVALVEWPAHDFDLAAARRLAAETERTFRRVPGLLDIRFFGDFTSGVHYYLLTWRDQAAFDAYAQSEAMFANRSIAEPYVAGKPTRTVLVDYTPPRA
jgi:quinol monooxygenase YgiN